MTKTVQFNFNNEADILELRMNEETGVVTIPEQEDLEFESMEKFAEHYAMARNVSPDRLKNWVLTSSGSVYTFSLRAATAGVNANDIREELINAINDSSDDIHPLDVVSFRQEVENAPDIVDALANASNRDLARDVYNVLNEAGLLEEVEYDEFGSVIEHMDDVFERTGTYALFAHVLNMDLSATKEAIVNRIRATYDYAYDFSDVFRERIYLDCQRANIPSGNADLLTALLTQAPVGVVDESAVNKICATAAFARRTKVNIRTVYVGSRYVKDTANYVGVGVLEEDEVYTLDGSPVIYVFDTAIDDEIEALLSATENDEDDAETSEDDAEVEFEVDEV